MAGAAEQRWASRFTVRTHTHTHTHTALNIAGVKVGRQLQLAWCTRTHTHTHGSQYCWSKGGLPASTCLVHTHMHMHTYTHAHSFHFCTRCTLHTGMHWHARTHTPLHQGGYWAGHRGKGRLGKPHTLFFHTHMLSWLKPFTDCGTP